MAKLAEGPVPATLDLDILVEQRRTWNVIAETERGRSDNVVMAGAHLDGVQDGPGINDNGSGSASLLETAIQLKKFEKKLNNKVRFAWWGAEEVGLLGLDHYVNDLVANDPAALDDIAAYLNYDMVGLAQLPDRRVRRRRVDEPASAPVPAGSIETEKRLPGVLRRDRPAGGGRGVLGTLGLPGVHPQRRRRGRLSSGSDGIKTEAEEELFGGEAGVSFDPNYHSPGDDYDNVNRGRGRHHLRRHGAHDDLAGQEHQADRHPQRRHDKHRVQGAAAGGRLSALTGGGTPPAGPGAESAHPHQTRLRGPCVTSPTIAERLDGQHVLLTGVTGFIGEALLQLMLAETPGVRVSVLVRPKGSTSGEKRIASLLGKPIFSEHRRVPPAASSS